MQLSDRMKYYEGLCQQELLPLVPVIARLDGRAFHAFCRHMRKPFDQEFHDVMVHTTKTLVEKTGARLGYTQSDEISLLLYSDNIETQIFFDGRVMKLCSILAAMASTIFSSKYCWDTARVRVIDKGVDNLPVFDCRVSNYPVEEVANYFIWREQDAVRNSIQAAAQAHFSHKSLHKLNNSQLQEKLFQEKGINWNDYPACQKRGTYVQAKTVTTPFTTEELSELPPKHNAHKNPHLTFERRRVEVVELPILTKVSNRAACLLYGHEPAL